MRWRGEGWEHGAVERKKDSRRKVQSQFQPRNKLRWHNSQVSSLLSSCFSDFQFDDCVSNFKIERCSADWVANGKSRTASMSRNLPRRSSPFYPQLHRNLISSFAKNFSPNPLEQPSSLQRFHCRSNIDFQGSNLIVQSHPTLNLTLSLFLSKSE